MIYEILPQDWKVLCKRYPGIFARLTVDLLRAQGTTSGTVVFSPSTETLDSGRYVA